MCYSDEILGEVIASGHQWLILSGVACPASWPLDKVYHVEHEGKRVSVFFRDDVLSNKVSFKEIGANDFLEHLKQIKGERENAYVVTAMDAETYGHHIQNWEELFLSDVYAQLTPVEKTRAGIRQVKAQFTQQQPVTVCPVCDTKFAMVAPGELPPKGYVNCPSCQAELVVDFKETEKGADKTGKSTPEGKRPGQAPEVKMVTISRLLQVFPQGEVVSPKPSSWSTTAEDIAANNPYPLWLDKDNEIHRLQWEHLRLSIEMVNKARECGNSDECSFFGAVARSLLDMAEHSCQFWWASRRPNWDINLIHLGLIDQWRAIVNAYRAINKSGADAETKTNYYHKVVAARDIRNKIIDRLFIL
jgi:alpha-amylase/alpha-mannosidase (GH57 family)